MPAAVPIAAAAIPAIGSVVGGVMANNGAQAAAQTSASAQEQTNASNQQIAADQEKFQEQMSNTSYQRGVADMKAAGINPMLAASNGGASSPAGASIAMQNPQSQAAGISAQGAAALGSAVSGATSSAVQGWQTAKSIENMQANTALTQTKQQTENWNSVDAQHRSQISRANAQAASQYAERNANAATQSAEAQATLDTNTARAVTNNPNLAQAAAIAKLVSPISSAAGSALGVARMGSSVPP